MRLSVASSLSLASALVSATPVEIRDAVTTLTTEVYDNMKYYVQYSASAYCNSQDAVGATVDCGDSGCPNVTANGATIVGVFPNTTTFDLEGYVATDSTREEIVVAFRGSSSLRNWIADFDFLFTSYDACSGCYVHDGFYDSWNEIKSYAYEYVESAYSSYPDYTLVIAGHSLGAAVGTLAAAEFRESGYPCDVYTVGSPRVGNEAFAKYVTAQTTGNEYRATHYDDPVPRLPPIVFGYHHTSPEYWLEAGPATNTDYSISDIEICLGYSNTSCNAGTTGLDGDAHEYYFQYMSCGTEDNGISLRRRDELLIGRDDTNSTDISDEELAAKLTNYTMQDIEYSKTHSD